MRTWREVINFATQEISLGTGHWTLSNSSPHFK